MKKSQMLNDPQHYSVFSLVLLILLLLRLREFKEIEADARKYADSVVLTDPLIVAHHH